MCATGNILKLFSHALPPDDEAFVADEGGRGEVDGEPVYYRYDPLPPDKS